MGRLEDAASLEEDKQTRTLNSGLIPHASGECDPVQSAPVDLTDPCERRRYARWLETETTSPVIYEE